MQSFKEISSALDQLVLILKKFIRRYLLALFNYQGFYKPIHLSNIYII